MHWGVQYQLEWTGGGGGDYRNFWGAIPWLLGVTVCLFVCLFLCQLKSTAGRTPVSRVIRRTAWCRIRGVYRFYEELWRILIIIRHHIRNNSGLVEPKDRNTMYSGFIISLIQQIHGSIWLRRLHKIASRAAGWKALYGLVLNSSMLWWFIRQYINRPISIIVYILLTVSPVFQLNTM